MTTTAQEFADDQAARPAAANPTGIELEQMCDRELVMRIAAGDRDAMGVLYARHHEGVYRLARRIARSRQAAEDIASDVFLDVWRSAGDFEHQCETATWLFAIARNKSIGVVRRNRTEPLDEEAMLLIEDEADGPDVLLYKQDARSALRRCVEDLSPAHRSVIELVYFQEKSIVEAAATSGIALGTVKTRLFYARERLAEMLGVQEVPAAAARTNSQYRH
jgi:RNA polymerase sigma-70 factor (ECF subfamily)